MEKIHGDGATSGEGISNNISSTSSSAEVEKKKVWQKVEKWFQHTYWYEKNNFPYLLTTSHHHKPFFIIQSCQSNQNKKKILNNKSHMQKNKNKKTNYIHI
jgi:hypothetical protein